MTEKLDSRRQGESVEALFVARAIMESLNVAKPWSGACRWDFALSDGGRPWRVQGKSVRVMHRPGSYHCQYQTARSQPYGEDEFDFVAIYIIPQDLWYIIPVEALVHKGKRITGTIVLSPFASGSKYHAYKEAWHLLREPHSVVIPRIEACADPDFPCDDLQWLTPQLPNDVRFSATRGTQYTPGVLSPED